MYKLFVIKIDESFNFNQYMDLFFTEESKSHINSFYQTRDRVITFTSMLLKQYFLPIVLSLSPKEMTISFNKYGKPFILNHPNIDFNISHSGNYVVLGISYVGKIGVDIELIDNNTDIELKEVAFNSFESQYIDNILDFYILWTKKEAYLKCCGVGFMTDDYRNTQLTNELTQNIGKYCLNSTILDNNYVLSICYIQ